MQHMYINIIWVSGPELVFRGKRIQPTGFAAYSSICFKWDGQDVPVPLESLNSHPNLLVQN